MESDISSVLPNYQLELLKYNRDHTDNEEAKQALDDMIKKMENEAKIKLIVPEDIIYPKVTLSRVNLVTPNI